MYKALAAIVFECLWLLMLLLYFATAIVGG
jgi:hypothetical protein